MAKRIRSARATLRVATAMLAAMALAGPAAAEVRILEVVGAVPLDEATRRSGIPKDKAIDAALWEGVSRVAGDLLVDAVLPETEDETSPVEQALGQDMVAYTKSFRIIEDQGERPALFTEHPDAATEYVVVVEVQVEVDRVRERLTIAGLLETDGLLALTGIQLEVRDLTDYRGFEALTDLIVAERVGAASVSPLALERGRALLQVEAAWGASELLERLLAAASPALRITPIEVRDVEDSGDGWGLERGPSRLVVSVDWTPPPPADEPQNAYAPGRVGPVSVGPPPYRR